MSSSASDDPIAHPTNIEPLTPEVARLARACEICGYLALLAYFAVMLAALLPLLVERPELISLTAPVGKVAAYAAALPGAVALLLAWRVRRHGVRLLHDDSRLARSTLAGSKCGALGLLLSITAWVFTLTFR